MKGQFKVGDSIRVKYGISRPEDILAKYWEGIGQISIYSILAKTLTITNTYEEQYDQGVRVEGSMYTYPAELFELVSSQHSSTPKGEDIQPGDYIYIRQAGGWSYSHTDDYTIAQVTNVGPYKSEPELGRGFGGILLKNGRRFHNIPEFNRSRKVIVTKATRDDFKRLGIPLPPEYGGSYGQSGISTSTPSVTKMNLDPLPRERKEKRVEIQSTRNLTV